MQLRQLFGLETPAQQGERIGMLKETLGGLLWLSYPKARIPEGK